MKVFSIPQPWASLTIIKHPGKPGNVAINGWVIRKWKPDLDNLESMQSQGILIHATGKWGKPQRDTMLSWPFNTYRRELEDMPFGALIGRVKLGRIMHAKRWIQEANLNIVGEGPHVKRPEGSTLDDEQFELLRFAWLEHYIYELVDPVRFVKPIVCKSPAGRLWDYPEEILLPDLPEAQGEAKTKARYSVPGNVTGADAGL